MDILLPDHEFLTLVNINVIQETNLHLFFKIKKLMKLYYLNKNMFFGGNSKPKTQNSKLKTLLFVGAVVGSFAACSGDFLSIEPTDLVTEEKFLSTEKDAQEALNGAYDALTFDKFLGGHCQHLSELMADNYNVSPAIMNNADWQAHATWTTDIFLGTTTELMQDGYKGSSRANYLLDRLDKVPGLSADAKKRMTAEAKFVRAICYFELVRLFGQPYGYTPDNSHLGIVARTSYAIDPLPRATVKEVYDLVISDLQSAAADLPARNGVYATTWSAKGYLSKVYFQQNRFKEAHDLADDVIKNGGFQLDTSVMARFRKGGSSENVFALVSTDYDNDNAGKRLKDNFRQNPSTKVAPTYMSSAIYNATAVEPRDKRAKQWYVESDFGPFKVFAFKKFPTEPAEGPVTVPLVCLSELKLIRAEAAAELGVNLETAAQDVKDIQARAGITPNVIAEKGVIIDRAREQRRIELAGEGNRLHELKRQAVRGNRTLKIRNAAPWDCPGMVCQLPGGELQSNRALKPNPTGGCQ